MGNDQAEELASLVAIYGDDALRVDGATASIRLQCGDSSEVMVSVLLPPGYPAHGDPSVELEGLPRGMRDSLMGQITRLVALHRGEAMLFVLIEAVRENLAQLAESSSALEEEARRARDAAHAAKVAQLSLRELGAPHPAAARGVEVVHGEPMVVMKSTFVAHVARVRSREDCEAVLAELYQDSKVARATHNMRAYRFVDERTGGQVCDNDDDGEDAAGGRLAMLLEAMRAENTMVVVSRWYGGVLMGPLRFKVINDCARLLIEAQPWFAGRQASK